MTSIRPKVAIIREGATMAEEMDRLLYEGAGAASMNPGIPALGMADVMDQMTKAMADEAIPPQAAPAPDPVNHPKHYNSHPSGVECITVTEWFNFNLGNVIKYVWRAGEKGDHLADLRKAKWYIEREIARLEGVKVSD